MAWFNNLKIRSKFIVVTMILVLFITVLGVAGLMNAVRLYELVDDATTTIVPGTYNLAVIIEDTYAVQIDIYKSLNETDPKKIQELADHTKKELGVLNKAWEDFKKLEHSSKEKEDFGKINDNLKEWTQNITSFYELKLSDDVNKQAKSQEILPILISTTEEIAETVEDLAGEHANEAEQLKKNAERDFTIALIRVFGAAVVTLVICILVFRILSRSINLPLRKLQKATQLLATGDLTQEVQIHTKDEPGELAATYNTTLLSLRQLLTQLNQHSHAVNRSTEELATQTVQQLHSGVLQAEAINQAAQSIEELSSTAENITQQALEVAQASTYCLEQTNLVSNLVDAMVKSHQQGQATISHTLQGIYQLKEQIAAIKLQQQILNSHAGVIQKVLELIEGTASELQLLSLNAAIEAAGAAEQGHRFGVVATEVKMLADRFGKSTKDIRNVLNQVTLALEEVSLRTEHSLQQAEEVVREANLSEELLESFFRMSEDVKEATSKIVTEVKVTNQLAVSIEIATTQQKTANKLTLEKMTEIDLLTQQNLNSLQQAKLATQRLQLTTQELSTSATAFKLANEN